MLGAEPPINDDFMDYLSVNLEDNLDLEERNVESVHLVGLLVTDVEPSQLIIKDVLRSIWRKMDNIKVLRAKANVYSIEVGDEQVARRILAVPGSSKVHLLQSNFDPFINNWMKFVQIELFSGSKSMGSPRICALLRMLECLESLLTTFNTPYPINGLRTMRLKYEDLRDFSYNCGHLGHVRGCQWSAPVQFVSENRYNPDLRASPISKHSNCLFYDWAPPARVVGV
ncbi:hypothetical protein ACFX11_030376 [Malus domestica]